MVMRDGTLQCPEMHEYRFVLSRIMGDSVLPHKRGKNTTPLSVRWLESESPVGDQMKKGRARGILSGNNNTNRKKMPRKICHHRPCGLKILNIDDSIRLCIGPGAKM